MRGRTLALALIAGSVLAMSWAVWSPLRRAPAASPAPAARSGAKAATAARAVDSLDVHAGRLRRRAEEAPAPMASRDPFRFRAPEVPPLHGPGSGTTRLPALVVGPADARATAEAGTPFALSGIAEEAGPEGPVRTAILSAPRALYHVEVGGVVLGRYRVIEISATRVTVLDLESGRTSELVLKAR
jgi:hypothetical protein